MVFILYLPIALVILGTAVRFFNFPYVGNLLVDIYNARNFVHNSAGEEFDYRRMNNYIGYSLIIMSAVLITGFYVSIVLLPEAIIVSRIIAAVMLVDLISVAGRYDRRQPQRLQDVIVHFFMMFWLTMAITAYYFLT